MRRVIGITRLQKFHLGKETVKFPGLIQQSGEELKNRFQHKTLKKTIMASCMTDDTTVDCNVSEMVKTLIDNQEIGQLCL